MPPLESSPTWRERVRRLCFAVSVHAFEGSGFSDLVLLHLCTVHM